MNVKIYDVEGKVESSIDVPVNLVYIRYDVIRRAVLSEESKMYQPKGNHRWAGMDTSARFVGREGIYRSLKDQGQARLPRELLGGGRYGRVRVVPHSVKGRRAHPPKPEKIILEKINKKEWKMAILHTVFGTNLFVIKDLEKIQKTKDGQKILEKFVELNAERKRVTGVRRKRKTRAYKEPVRVTVITKEEAKGFSNILGVRYNTVDRLQVKDVAPGGEIKGRNLIISYDAFLDLMSRLGVKL